MKKESNTLLNWNETEQVGFNGFKDEDNRIIFEDTNGLSFEIDARNVTYIINWSNPDLPAGYYRENKVFHYRN